MTLGAPKLPLVLPPAREMAGELVVADIGIPPTVIEALERPDLRLLTRRGVCGRSCRARRRDAHKGTFGHVLVVAGLARQDRRRRTSPPWRRCGRGAGLVTVATPRSCQPIVATLGAEYMTERLDETRRGHAWRASALPAVLAHPATVIAAGPGPRHRRRRRRRSSPGLVARADGPLVLDADALNAFAGRPGRADGARRASPIVITPHPGEMARLLGVSIADVQAHRLDIGARPRDGAPACTSCSRGTAPSIATPDGRVYINPTGQPRHGHRRHRRRADRHDRGLAGAAARRRARPACSPSTCTARPATCAAGDEGEVSMTAGDLLGRIGDARARADGAPDAGRSAA